MALIVIFLLFGKWIQRDENFHSCWCVIYTHSVCTAENFRFSISNCFHCASHVCGRAKKKKRMEKSFPNSLNAEAKLRMWSWNGESPKGMKTFRWITSIRLIFNSWWKTLSIHFVFSISHFLTSASTFSFIGVVFSSASRAAHKNLWG